MKIENKFLLGFISVTLGIIYSWLIGSFVTLDLNLLQWDPIGRWMMFLGAVVISVTTFEFLKKSE